MVEERHPRGKTHMANKTNKQAEQSQAKPEQPTWQPPDDVKNNGEVWSYHYLNKMWFYYDSENSKYISVRYDGQRFLHPSPPPSKEVAPSSSAAPSLTQAAQRKRSHSGSSPPLMESTESESMEPSWYLPDSLWYNGEDWHFHYHLSKWFYYDYKYLNHILLASDGTETCKPEKPPKPFATDAAAPASPPAQSRSQGVSADGRVSSPLHHIHRDDKSSL
ncbi:unnamed protein product [Zymoseptoria tritici ST99CH_1A5]|uniref:Uncharacterized protein n=1 Tax=Zymoseptoria tritici ST99CH_1A5 TaxID=1276529 RepID=A0A1Y6LWY0_ZYMTR|nr:unnamed protein product [Zymoseptoria tritici ST99CH_1A5]